MSAHARVVEMARAYIEAHLSQPELDMQHVAEHCGISVSYLHACFASQSLNAGALMRALRVERCHAALSRLD